ncbi:MAG: type II restriction endonuclease subunit M [Verrucomicrobiaceae bacterium]|nr:MAG: type II restriction endonuclease subunit M [Verrucomicrobiaceae bacterium]
MPGTTAGKAAKRYETVEQKKSSGATYTPGALATFVARRMLENTKLPSTGVLRILDPAVGDGELVLSLLAELKVHSTVQMEVFGFDTDPGAIAESQRRISQSYPNVTLHLSKRDFLEFVLSQGSDRATQNLFSTNEPERFDLIIANPPYVRTQIMGADQAQQLAASFGLGGRVDLYQAFLLGMARVLEPAGTAGMIVSNRFMTTKGGGLLRSALRQQFALREIWDLGDTKLFDAAVLPAIVIASGQSKRTEEPIKFSSAYETTDPAVVSAVGPVEALGHEGVVQVADGRSFDIKHGTLDSIGGDEEIWRISTGVGDAWMATVNQNTWALFGALGKIRVGVKTCADKVFIRHDWGSAFGDDKPELLRPLTTHHGAGRFRATVPKKARQIVYPHEVVQGQRRAISLDDNPKTQAYLESHRETLEARTYVLEGGRRWYEIWVPQDPSAWALPKLVFRDISERPTFWIDLDGSVVNGDCYWLVLNRQDNPDLLWLAAAVANSTFAEAFYDHRFNNKLYAGRRRYITQYVEQFPLPNPELATSKEIVERAKAIYNENHSSGSELMELKLNDLVWKAFGLPVKKVVG